jgi:hypothetical protein
MLRCFPGQTFQLGRPIGGLQGTEHRNQDKLIYYLHESSKYIFIFRRLFLARPFWLGLAGEDIESWGGNCSSLR